MWFLFLKVILSMPHQQIFIKKRFKIKAPNKTNEPKNSKICIFEVTFF
jgi:hypothetical protein